MNRLVTWPCDSLLRHRSVCGNRRQLLLINDKFRHFLSTSLCSSCSWLRPLDDVRRTFRLPAISALLMMSLSTDSACLMRRLRLPNDVRRSKNHPNVRQAVSAYLMKSEEKTPPPWWGLKKETPPTPINSEEKAPPSLWCQKSRLRLLDGLFAGQKNKSRSVILFLTIIK